ncbi:Short-chain dehydrogenase/reductase tropE [Colletotrichum trifolii]|uniref:Short-chain dehydrogenase/reductase tropE n=1 Tax=Colletotrichum trifolii TaxID=5466 RepID=A0A4R8RP96_COLTR|nr:Short-chain dehydrogenase/reductase tropE [Colletotrichum trifolii]
MSKTPSDPVVALVTGANQGIGYEIAKRLATEHPDYHVYMTGRRQDAVEKAAAELQAAGLSVEPLVMDVTSDISILLGVGRVQAKFDRLDVLVNNAGISHGPAPEGGEGEGEETTTTRQRFASVYDTNVFGAVAVTEAFLPLLRNARRRPRCIVFVSSGLGSLKLRTDPDFEYPEVGVMAYASSKAALNHAAMGFAAQFRGDETWKVNVCCPGYCTTNMTDYRGTDEPALGSIQAVKLATLGVDGMTATFTRRQGPIAW